MKIYCLTYVGVSAGLLPASPGTIQCHMKEAELRLGLHARTSEEGPHN